MQSYYLNSQVYYMNICKIMINACCIITVKFGRKLYITNFQYVTKYLKGKGGMVEMFNGSVVDVSVNRKAEFLEKFK